MSRLVHLDDICPAHEEGAVPLPKQVAPQAQGCCHGYWAAHTLIYVVFVMHMCILVACSFRVSSSSSYASLADQARSAYALAAHLPAGLSKPKKAILRWMEAS